jgi:4-hydroxy-tetrahydrodipicolinate synthase
MIFTPPGRISEAGLVAYFCAVAEQTQLGVIPYLSMPVSLPSLEAMIAIPTVVAVKDATGDLAWFRRGSRVAIPKVNWFCEGEILAPYYLLHDATGVTSGVANFVPELSLELYDAAQRGDFRRAAELQRLLDPWAELRAKPGNLVPVIKAAMDRLGLAGGPVRLPLLPLVEADVRELDRLIATLPRKAGPGAQEEQTA